MVVIEKDIHEYSHSIPTPSSGAVLQLPYNARAFPKLTCNYVLEECLKTRVVSTVGEFKNECHAADTLVAQLFVDIGEIFETVVPKVDF